MARGVHFNKVTDGDSYNRDTLPLLPFNREKGKENTFSTRSWAYHFSTPSMTKLPRVKKRHREALG